MTTLAESCSIITSSISDYNLVEITLRIHCPLIHCKDVTTRSYSGYAPNSFWEDLSLVPWHMKYFFDDIVSEVKTLNSLFSDVLDQHAPIKRIKITSRSNPFVTPEIKQRMKTRNRWHSDLRQTTLERISLLPTRSETRTLISKLVNNSFKMAAFLK